MKKKHALAVAVIASLAAAFAPSCAKAGKVEGKLAVVASFDAIAEFARAVGGDKVAVTTLTPAGVEPHEFEPKARDMATLARAAVFVFNGLGMESWVDKAITASGNARLVAVDASEGAETIANTDSAAVEEHGRYDPHLWLGLTGAAVEARNIAAAFSKADPRNASYYEKNRDAFAKALDDMRVEYAEKLRAAKTRAFIAGHAAFAYFCRDFGLEQRSVEDVFAEGEPTAKDLAALVDYCRKNAIKTIFAEEMASPDVSRTLAAEVGAKVETIATIEGPEGGRSYLARQRDNLDKVYAALVQ